MGRAPNGTPEGAGMVGAGGERRSEARAATSIAGSVIATGGARFRCMVSNLSRNGAEVEVDEAGRVPRAFTLELGQGGPRHGAVVAWRRPDRVGVTFPVPREAPPVLAF